MSLAHVPLDALTVDDLERLVENRVPEGTHLEFKHQLNFKTDADKAEFLKDVSGMANAGGGDVVYGISEDRATGVAARIFGMPLAKPQQQETDLLHCARDGLDPMIHGLQVRAVPVDTSHHVLVVRIPRTYNPPHMVVRNNAHDLFLRHEKSVTAMSIEELRQAILNAERVPERARELHRAAVERARSGSGLVELQAPGILVLTLVPLTAVSGSRSRVDIVQGKSLIQNTRPPWRGPMRRSHVAVRYNLDGAVYLMLEVPSIGGGYVQLHRSGVLEVAGSGYVEVSEASRRLDAGIVGVLRTRLEEYLHVLKQLGVSPPVVLQVTLLDVKMAVMEGQAGDAGAPLDRDTVPLPDVVVETLDPGIATGVLRPVLDALWNACGHARCPWYDENGIWIGQ